MGVSVSQSFGGHVIEGFLTARVTPSSPQSFLDGGESGRPPFFNKLRVHLTALPLGVETSGVWFPYCR